MAAATRLLRLLLITLLAGAAVFSPSPVAAARDVPAEPVAVVVSGAGDLVVGDAEPSAYEMLERFGFPKGILPEGVTGYTLRRSDGAFQVFMDRDCEFEVDGGYRLTYQRTISGTVAGGSIRDLRGVSVRMFFVNWGIDQVLMADADHLMFYVGPLSQAFPADNFEESPQCRCRGVLDGAGVGAGVAAM
ncbi:hypothetical protein QYE76_013073 [Lolium multiflorum]|uniref:Uncharacterized protein n=1 Tax=Lolium multiflorum TaxID=4521 RepID=A0AAD8X4H9_LOLMU|nr:hypothetical protein QYE76_008270 [Lolium multiflorum]KAK1696376.1 hypothetical protein QYE76_013073 [Lolium multiflorum]